MSFLSRPKGYHYCPRCGGLYPQGCTCPCAAERLLHRWRRQRILAWGTLLLGCGLVWWWLWVMGCRALATMGGR